MTRPEARRPRICGALTLLLLGAIARGPVDQAEFDLLAGRAEEASIGFERVLEEDPTNERALLGRIDALVFLGDWATALEEARRRHREAPESFAAAVGLSEALVRAGELNEAEELLERIVERIEPGTELPGGRALALMGSLRAAAGRTDEAIELMTRAVEAAPDDRRVLFRAAEATATRGEAVRRLERYLELAEGDDPDRIEGVRGTLRVLRQLGERRIWIPGSRPERESWPLRWILEQGRPVGGILRVRLGDKGKKVRLLFDTGSSGLFLDESVASRVGFEPLAEETTFGGGGDQRHRSRRGIIPSLRLGSLEFRDVMATTVPDAFPAGASYRGVVGLGMLGGYRVTIDLERGRLQVDRGEALNEGDRYWTVSGQMLVPAVAASGHEGLFLFDTGATRTVLGVGFVRSCPEAVLNEPTRVGGFGGEVLGARLVEGLTLHFQGMSTPAAPLRAVDLTLRSRLAGVELSGYVGMDLLYGQRLVVDTRTRRIVAERSAD